MSEEEATEITIDHDSLINQISARNSEDGERASSAGESRAEMKAFLEDTGIHNKAFSHIRAGMKIKKESQRLDWLRSMEVMLPMVAAEIRGQSTPDMFEAPAAEPVPDDEAESYLGPRAVS